MSSTTTDRERRPRSTSPRALLPPRSAWRLMGVLFAAVGVLVISSTALPASSGARTTWVVQLADLAALATAVVCIPLAHRLPGWALGPFLYLGTLLITVCVLVSGGGLTAGVYAVTYLVAVVYARLALSRGWADVHFATLLAVAVPALAVQPGVPAGEQAVLWGMAVMLSLVVRWLAAALQRTETDDLTRLPNRRGLDRLLDGARDAGAGLVVVALPDLQSVNRVHGREAVDRMLLAAADRLRTRLPRGGALCRTGGASFAAVLPRTDLVGTAAAAGDLCAALQDLGPWVAGSAGREPGEPAGALLERAESASAVAAADGAGAVHEHPGTGQEGRELREALERQELVVHVQPIVDLADGRIVGAEALVRWQHPERGLLAPGAFLPEVERCGLGAVLGAYVLRAACRAAARWPATADGSTPYLSVNASGEELLDERYASTVELALMGSGLPASRLVVELVESDYDASSAVVRGNLERLQELGVRTAVDDFGTGYSSLDRLRRSGSDLLKVDRSFIADIASPEQDAPLVSAALALASALGMQAVAEGVETPEQAEWLRRRGCALAQGWLYSPAVPDARFATLLQDDQRRLVPGGAR